LRKKLKKYVRYGLGVGAFAHFIELISSLYEQAYITASITAIFGCLDLLGAYVLSEKEE